jgi:hypothetical protein
VVPGFLISLNADLQFNLLSSLRKSPACQIDGLIVSSRIILDDPSKVHFTPVQLLIPFKPSTFICDT